MGISLKYKRFAAWAILGVGMAHFATALMLLIHTERFLTSAKTANGSITELVESHADNGVMYYPVFSFRDAEGVQHTVHSNMGSMPPAHEVGDSVKVLYRAESPNDAKIDDFFSIWGLPAIFGGFGVVTISVGLFLRFWMGWRGPLRGRE